MIRFICGCTSKIDEAAPLTDGIFATFDAVVKDDEDFMVCLIHHQRRYGWRTVPYTATKPPGIDPAWSPYEYERWLFWGEITRPKVAGGASTMPDNRDNRDPQVVGQNHLDNRLVGNGP